MKTKQSGEALQPNKVEEKALVCTICGRPAARLVDGEPSCEDHAALVYENQLEDDTKGHLGYKETSKL